MRPLRTFLSALLLFALCHPLVAQKRITAAEAKGHIGEEVTVCGKVASTRFASSTRGQPTFLNIDKPYPNQVFTVIIWGNNRDRFGNPEVLYRDKRICVTGKVTEYRGGAEIEARVPSQITIEKE